MSRQTWQVSSGAPQACSLTLSGKVVLGKLQDLAAQEDLPSLGRGHVIWETADSSYSGLRLRSLSRSPAPAWSLKALQGTGLEWKNLLFLTNLICPAVNKLCCRRYTKACSSALPVKHLGSCVLDLLHQPGVIKVWEQQVHEPDQALDSQNVCRAAIPQASMLHLQHQEPCPLSHREIDGSSLTTSNSQRPKVFVSSYAMSSSDCCQYIMELHCGIGRL